jgi:hypothetical protein
MVLRLNQNATVENTRHHPAEEIEAVRKLLAAGAPAQPDPHRAHFYELENTDRVFYIYLSPVTGHVLLLASWGKDAAPQADAQIA